jgi:hypothetical protein
MYLVLNTKTIYFTSYPKSVVNSNQRQLSRWYVEGMYSNTLQASHLKARLLVLSLFLSKYEHSNIRQNMQDEVLWHAPGWVVNFTVFCTKIREYPLRLHYECVYSHIAKLQLARFLTDSLHPHLGQNIFSRTF